MMMGPHHYTAAGSCPPSAAKAAFQKSRNFHTQLRACAAVPACAGARPGPWHPGIPRRKSRVLTQRACRAARRRSAAAAAAAHPRRPRRQPRPLPGPPRPRSVRPPRHRRGRRLPQHCHQDTCQQAPAPWGGRHHLYQQCLWRSERGESPRRGAVGSWARGPAEPSDRRRCRRCCRPHPRPAARRPARGAGARRRRDPRLGRGSLTAEGMAARRRAGRSMRGPPGPPRITGMTPSLPQVLRPPPPQRPAPPRPGRWRCPQGASVRPGPVAARAAGCRRKSRAAAGAARRRRW
jgi:hypothetical protein